MHFNEVTGRMEGDEETERTRERANAINLPLVPASESVIPSALKPGTGAPIETYPDTDIKMDERDPRYPYGKPLLGTTTKIQTTPGAAPARLGTAPNAIPLTGETSEQLKQRLEGAPPVAAGTPAAPVNPAAPLAPAAPEPPPGPPPLVTVGTSSTTQTAQKKMTAEEKAAQAKLDVDLGAEKEFAGRKSEADKAAAEQELQRTRESNTELAAQQEQADAALALQDQTIKRLEAHVDVKRKEYEETPLKDFWSSKTNGARFLAAISSSAGAFAAIRSGGRNYAQETLDKAIDNDFKMQMAQIDKRKDILMLAKQDVQAAEAKKKGLYYDLQIKKIALLEKAERMRSEDRLAHGIATADLAKDGILLAIQKKRDEETAALWQGLRKEVQTSTTTQRAPLSAPGSSPNGDPMLVTDAAGRPVGRATTSPKAAEEARAALGGYQKFNQSANELVDLMNKHGTQMTGEVSGRMTALRGELIGAARAALFPGGGTLDEGFVKLLDDMVANPASFSGKASRVATLVAKMNQAQKAVDRTTRSALGAAGIPANRLDPRSLQ